MPEDLQIRSVGNIVAPLGGSITFGDEASDDFLIITEENEHTYDNPYNIIITGEDTEDTLPADQISYSITAGSELTASTVQEAIEQLEQMLYGTTPVMYTDIHSLSDNETTVSLNKTFYEDSMLVFYNGLLLNPITHYTFTGSSISLDFEVLSGDILTVVGVSTAYAESGGSLV